MPELKPEMSAIARKLEPMYPQGIKITFDGVEKFIRDSLGFEETKDFSERDIKYIHKSLARIRDHKGRKSHNGLIQETDIKTRRVKLVDVETGDIYGEYNITINTTTSISLNNT